MAVRVLWERKSMPGRKCKICGLGIRISGVPNSGGIFQAVNFIQEPSSTLKSVGQDGAVATMI